MTSPLTGYRRVVNGVLKAFELLGRNANFRLERRSIPRMSFSKLIDFVESLASCYHRSIIDPLRRLGIDPPWRGLSIDRVTDRVTGILHWEAELPPFCLSVL